MIRLVTDFECGNGKNVEQLAEDRFRLEVDGDKQTGYGSYFCFDLINEGPAAGVSIDLREDSKWGGPTGFGSVFPTTLWIKPAGFHRYRPRSASQNDDPPNPLWQTDSRILRVERRSEWQRR